MCGQLGGPPVQAPCRPTLDSYIPLVFKAILFFSSAHSCPCYRQAAHGAACKCKLCGANCAVHVEGCKQRGAIWWARAPTNARNGHEADTGRHRPISKIRQPADEAATRRARAGTGRKLENASQSQRHTRRLRLGARGEEEGVRIRMSGEHRNPYCSRPT